ncbi:DNA methylase [Metamycoplasma arthritidis]|uniref:N6-adenine-specific methylase n=1 Tax=Metamycoplasma arthritidis (strain 158L3-1) TaxID=243272 RepID=B3PN73_META1|nr:16S rRNA (guanine(966)-N(2))-methyltransferase RsmD [Metamycoplasma arthritidis]ACF07475.1 N6-adenine-specific methylase [Metamycoplasma arthritidis 158L3-1]VEU78996.1 DNA methylase [Metamycoplasma arthritidis]
MLRIVAGKYRSRIIEQPSKSSTRPTIDKVREAIFSSIHFELDGAEVLDLFAGSGSFCLEALSRGAAFATCIEKDYDAYKIIQKNALSLGETKINILNVDAIYFLENNASKKWKFIYLDPPFASKELLKQCIKLISDSSLLLTNGKVIVETDAANLELETEKLAIVKCKKYGRIYIYYLTYKG